MGAESALMTALSLQGFHVLAVDDEEASLLVMIQMLGDLGIAKAVGARNGSEALTALLGAARPFDCILCDQRMPSGNGLQLLKAIRCGEVRTARPDTCFIFLTAVSDSTLIQKAAQLDANGYLTKPVTAERLRSSLVRGKTKSFAVDVTRYAQIAVPLSAI